MLSGLPEAEAGNRDPDAFAGPLEISNLITSRK